MNEAEEFFVCESIGRARELPLPDAIKFLRGLLSVCGDENEAVSVIRSNFTHLSESDRQLHLIQTRQMRLPLTKEEGENYVSE